MAAALSACGSALDFVIVARARGEATLYVMLQEILPNMIGPVLADFGLRFIYIVPLLSSLSFLGLGVQPPNADLNVLPEEDPAMGEVSSSAPKQDCGLREHA